MTSTTVTAPVRTPRAVPDREVTATRLLATSAKHSYNPDVDIDWDVPVDNGMRFAAEHRISLYGTKLWDQMSEQQRIDLGKYELCSIASVGLWTEEVLMQMLLRHAYSTDVLSAHHAYALTEIEDECRHSRMFARMIRTFGGEAFGPSTTVKRLGRVFGVISTWPQTFAGVYYVESYTDTLQREQMDDEGVHPIARQVARIHVIEEARHLKYARDELDRQLVGMKRAELEYTRLILQRTIHLTTESFVHPKVYKLVGLDPYEARKVARTNPHHIETRQFASRKALEMLSDVGLLGGPNYRLLRKSNLVTA
jgi:hypothetical protein